MMHDNYINIIGSGSNEPVYINNGNHLFINSSCARLKNTNYQINLLMTDGLLLSDQELMKLKPASGLSSNDSFKMRLGKRKTIQNLSIDKLFISTELSKKNIKKKLRSLSIQYKQLKIFNKRIIYFKTLKILISQRAYIKRKFLFLSIRSILSGIIFNKTVIGLYKPSTGMIAALMFCKNYKIKLDGIGNQNKSAFYGKEGELGEFKFNNIHERIDKIILDYLNNNDYTIIS